MLNKKFVIYALFIILTAVTVRPTQLFAVSYFDDILSQLESMNESFLNIQNTILPAIGIPIPQPEAQINTYNNTHYLTTIPRGPIKKTCPHITRDLRLRSKDTLHDHSVSSLQRFLKENRYYTKDITGYFGKNTAQAVKQWQLDHMNTALLLQESYFGEVTALTRAAIMRACKQQTAPCPKEVEKPLCDNGVLKPKYSANKCLIAWECIPSRCPKPFVENPPACSDGVLSTQYDKKGCFLGWKCDTIHIPNTPPTLISFTGPTTPVTSLANTWHIYFFDNDSTRFIYTIDWGDGQTNTDRLTKPAASIIALSPKHTYETPGNYTITLTVRDFSGNQMAEHLTVTVISKQVFCALKTDITSCALGYNMKSYTDTDGCVRHYCTFDRENTLTFSTDSTGTAVITGPAKLLAKLASTTVATSSTALDCGASVDWGDASTSSTPVAGEACATFLTHTYTTPGVYTVHAKIFHTSTSTQEQVIDWQNSRDIHINRTVSTTTAETATYTATHDGVEVLNRADITFGDAYHHCQNYIDDRGTWTRYTCTWDAQPFYIKNVPTTTATTSPPTARPATVSMNSGR